MKQTDPKITVVMPAFNAAKYIGKAISSVLAQTFTDFELLIINDGSTDNTAAVIHSFSDKRIRVIKQANRGVATQPLPAMRTDKPNIFHQQSAGRGESRVPTPS